jgi:hypothetical protein
MREAVRLAIAHGVAIGAHPSYPDRKGFGRVTRTLAPAALARAVAAQVAALVEVTDALGVRVRHVKPHGALYNDAAERNEVALAVAEGVASVSSALILVGLAGSNALRIWRDRGFRVAAEGFADRAYAAALPRLRAGMTERETAALLKRALADEGADSSWAWVVSGRGQYDRIDGIVRDRAIETGDLVFVDMGACVGGYWADFSRAAVIGRATAGQIRMQELVAEATRIKGDAEAAYNARVSSSLTPVLIQQQYLSKWDGRLPQYTFGANAVPFVQLPASASGTPDGPRR